MSEKCGTCTFFLLPINEQQPALLKVDSVGNCRRYPPRSFDLAAEGKIWKFPEVESNEWCGEYREAASLVAARAITERITVGEHDGKRPLPPGQKLR